MIVIATLCLQVLIPLNDYEKSSIQMLDRSGDVIGRKEDFRVNTCSIHERTGALLLSPDYELLMIGQSSGEMAATILCTFNFFCSRRGDRGRIHSVVSGQCADR